MLPSLGNGIFEIGLEICVIEAGYFEQTASLIVFPSRVATQREFSLKSIDAARRNCQHSQARRYTFSCRYNRFANALMGGDAAARIRQNCTFGPP